MSAETPVPPGRIWPLRYVASYQYGSSILPASTLLNGLLLLLLLFLIVMTGIFYAEGEVLVSLATLAAFVVVAYGMWHVNKRRKVGPRFEAP